MSSGPRKTYWVPAADIDIDALLFYVRTRIDTEGEVKAGNHYEVCLERKQAIER